MCHKRNDLFKSSGQSQKYNVIFMTSVFVFEPKYMRFILFIGLAKTLNDRSEDSGF